jgi:hypothetical protein
VAPFVGRSQPRRNEPHIFVDIRVNRDKHSAEGIEADRNRALLLVCRVVDGDGVRIFKHGFCVGEPDAMLAEVRACLIGSQTARTYALYTYQRGRQPTAVAEVPGSFTSFARAKDNALPGDPSSGRIRGTANDHANRHPRVPQHRDQRVDAEAPNLASHEVADARLADAEECGGLRLGQATSVNQLAQADHQVGSDFEVRGLFD